MAASDHPSAYLPLTTPQERALAAWRDARGQALVRAIRGQERVKLAMYCAISERTVWASTIGWAGKPAWLVLMAAVEDPEMVPDVLRDRVAGVRLEMARRAARERIPKPRVNNDVEIS